MGYKLQSVVVTRTVDICAARRSSWSEAKTTKKASVVVSKKAMVDKGAVGRDSGGVADYRFTDWELGGEDACVNLGSSPGAIGKDVIFQLVGELEALFLDGEGSGFGSRHTEIGRGPQCPDCSRLAQTAARHTLGQASRPPASLVPSIPTPPSQAPLEGRG